MGFVITIEPVTVVAPPSIIIGRVVSPGEN